MSKQVRSYGNPENVRECCWTDQARPAQATPSHHHNKNTALSKMAPSRRPSLCYPRSPLCAKDTMEACTQPTICLNGAVHPVAARTRAPLRQTVPKDSHVDAAMTTQVLTFRSLPRRTPYTLPRGRWRYHPAPTRSGRPRGGTTCGK